MNDRITDLLDDVADDTGRPLGFSVADVAARGRALRRRRTTAGAVALVAAAAAVAVAVAVVVPDERAAEQPLAPPTTATDSAGQTPTAPTTPPEPTGQDAVVLAGCVTVDATLDGWLLDAQVTDAEGSTATFVSAQGDRWRTCTLGFPGEEVTAPEPLDTGPLDEDEVVRQSGVDFGLLCPKEAPASCTRRLYDVELPLPEGVASIEVETPGGDRVDAVTGTSTYVVRFAESGVTTSVPPVVATLRDSSDGVLFRYDYNELLR
ncbi:hypothetical protein [Nocardioides sp.]|uniref:hypothetical protein n=1 Tax=Nocardioides sp. TaxID=35761 RepID=UPI0027194F58|nr:hypothetical protein [Nocardioides sp.]MDO9455834.1 hypothetical protein [Nocardioides sp.]